MRKFGYAMALLALAGLAGRAHAAAGNPVDVEVLAQINSTLQITVATAAGTTSYDFGTVGAGFSGVSAKFSVTNTGGGLTESYQLQGFNAIPGPWTLAAAAGVDQYALYAIFQTAGGGAPAVGAFTGAQHGLSTGNQSAAAGPGGKFAGTSDGFMTNQWETVDLYFRLDAPTSSSSAAQQHMKVQITAVTP